LFTQEGVWKWWFQVSGMTAEQSLPHALLFFHRLANTFLEALPGDFPFVSAAKVNKENVCYCFQPLL
jgi:hypothetical protein